MNKLLIISLLFLASCTSIDDVCSKNHASGSAGYELCARTVIAQMYRDAKQEAPRAERNKAGMVEYRCLGAVVAGTCHGSLHNAQTMQPLNNF